MIRGVRRAFGFWKNVKGVWAEAFPDEGDIAARMAQRKEEARLARERNEKILEAAALNEEEVPEWKRNAIIVKGQKVKKERSEFDDEDEDDEEDEHGAEVEAQTAKGRRQKTRSLWGNDDVSDFANEYEEADFYKEGVRENIGNRIAQTDNSLNSTTAYIKQKITERIGVDGSLEMYRRDPNFNFANFEDDLRHIFVETYNKFCEHDSEYVERSCGGDAFTTFATQIAVSYTHLTLPTKRRV